MSSVASTQPNTLLHNFSDPSKANTGSNNHTPAKVISPEPDVRHGRASCYTLEVEMQQDRARPMNTFPAPEASRSENTYYIVSARTLPAVVIKLI